MPRYQRFFHYTVLSLTLSTLCLVWPDTPPGLASSSTTPQGTVQIAFHSFSKERMTPVFDGTPGLPYHGQMFDWFIGATPEGQLSTENGVLEHYEANAEATVWSFRLRPGIRWHDGVAMTAEDLKFSIEFYAQPDSQCTQCGAVRANLDHVEMVDRATVRLHLKRPDVSLPAAFGPLEGNFLVLPKHHFAQVGPQGFEAQPLGSGPWKFVKREIGQLIEYEAHTDYWNVKRRPKFATLRMLLVPEARTRVAMLKRGEVDLISLEPQDVEPLKKEGFKILGPRDTGFPMLTFYRSYDPAFLTHKLAFRKALILGVDWEAVVKAYYPPEVAERQRGGAPLYSRVTLGYDAEIPPYAYNPQEARRLLKEVGYKGEKITFWNFFFTANPEQPEVNEVIASYWRKLELDVDLVTIDYAAFQTRLRSRPQKFDPPVSIGVQYPWARPSLVNNMRVFMLSHEDGGSTSAYWNPEKAARLFTEVSSIADVAARDQRLRALNRELYDEYWAMPIVIRHTPFAAGARIVDWRPSNGSPTALAFETLQPRP
ncbi:MAG: ABC transporter substrate-binding protein [Candidatus Tectimicrobiota bacterium]